MQYRCRNDSDWTMIEVSSGCRSVTGYEPEDLIGSRTVAYGSLIHEADRLNVSVEVQEALTSGRPFQIRYRIRHADGQLIQVWEQGEGIYGANGGIDEIFGVISRGPGLFMS